MKLIKTMAIVAAAFISYGITAYAASVPTQVDAVTAATQAAPDVDKILDRLESTIKKLEKIAAEHGGSLQGIKLDEVDSKLQAEVNAVGQDLAGIANAQLTPAQEQRAIELLGRLYTVMGDQPMM